MKLQIVDAEGNVLSEARFDAHDLVSGDMGLIAEHVINSSIKRLRQAMQPDNAPGRIVENPGVGSLESLDDDGTVLDRPLNLAEACHFDFDKHVEAITQQESEASERTRRRNKLHPRHEAQQRLDRLERERTGQLTRFK